MRTSAATKTVEVYSLMSLTCEITDDDDLICCFIQTLRAFRWRQAMTDLPVRAYLFRRN